MKLKQGLIQVYTGEGKGKTTAALGLAMRAAGTGLNVCVIQFIKGYKNIGELKSAKNLGENLQIIQFHDDRARTIGQPQTIHKVAAQKALKYVQKIIKEAKHDLVILDEINNALFYKLIPVKKVLEILDSKPTKMELVLTGRNAPAEILEKAHLVTEMKKIKHPFDNGINARKGIEY